ncbi:uncharacterized protein B0T23DRAFT_412194 [Neurospora hispaniola]|uniref:Uncharacterized protein n=1 Tax=Neurospora hispaniola TaxID=588809 RepID=A0AAJ0MT31_9PEZI|nr:hypothetical protein B0T23DRAFT_412194 [Neurospora hispaniola]
MYSTTTNAAILKDAWFNFRRDSLFRCQKHLIERYFYDHWLNHVRFNIYVDGHMPPGIRYRYGGKYMHAHNFPGIFSPDPQLTPNDNGDPETEKATFVFRRRKGRDCPRASLPSTWNRLMHATNNGWPPLHIEPPDGTRIDSIEVCLEGWEVSNDGVCISFPWKKLMTMVITRILEIWKMPPVVVDEDDLPLLPPPVDSLLVGWFMPEPSWTWH